MVEDVHRQLPLPLHLLHHLLLQLWHQHTARHCPHPCRRHGSVNSSSEIAQLNAHKITGVNDVPWNSQASDLPALSSLANNGIVLDNAYTLPVCTPSRCSKYKFYYKTPGELQGSTDDWNLPIQDGFATRIWKEESSGLCPLFLSFSLSHLEKLNLWIHFSREQKTNLKIDSQGVPTNITMMPQLLHRAGYATHGFGKCSKTLIQNSLGFDISLLRQVAPGVLL